MGGWARQAKARTTEGLAQLLDAVDEQLELALPLLELEVEIGGLGAERVELGLHLGDAVQRLLPRRQR